MSLRLHYCDVPDLARQSLAVEAAGASFSDPAVLTQGGSPVAYATLEPGVWTLDGSRRLLPDAPTGLWWSALPAGADGCFPEPVRITLTLPQSVSASGLTLAFDPATGQHCTDLEAVWYAGQTLLTAARAAPTGPEFVLEQAVEGFDRVELTLYAAAPGHFAKLRRVSIGQDIHFGPEALLSLALEHRADPTGRDLPSLAMTLELRDRAGRSLAPSQRQSLRLYRDDRLLATLCLTGCRRLGRHSYRLTAAGTEVLLGLTCLGGLYRQVPAAQVLQQLLPDGPWQLHSRLANATVTGWLPVCTQAEALAQVAFAIGARVRQLSDGTLLLEPPQSQVSGSLGPDTLMAGGWEESLPRYAAVELTAHSFTPGDSPVTLVCQSLWEEDVLLTFSAPHRDYAVTGGQLLDSGPNWVRLAAQGQVELTALPYHRGRVVHTWRDPRCTDPLRGRRLAVTGATLVGSHNAAAVLEGLAAHCGCTRRFSCPAVAEDLEPGQRISCATGWGTVVEGTVTTLEARLTDAGQVARVEVLGNRVPAVTARFYAPQLTAGEEALYEWS